jgi:hypothetical protein
MAPICLELYLIEAITFLRSAQALCDNGKTYRNVGSVFTVMLKVATSAQRHSLANRNPQVNQLKALNCGDL